MPSKWRGLAVQFADAVFRALEHSLDSRFQNIHISKLSAKKFKILDFGSRFWM